MMPRRILALISLLSVSCVTDSYLCTTFVLSSLETAPVRLRPLPSTISAVSDTDDGERQGNENKAMAFLKKIGKVGGSANRDFRFAIGVDEGSSRKSNNSLTKSAGSYRSCAESGVIDDLTETFPNTSCGTQWAGFTDQVMGGLSIGNLSRESFDGKTANVLRGRVSLANNGGFIQMATNLASFDHDYEKRFVDASKFKGIEVDVQSVGDSGSESFNIHLKNEACPKPYTSYRATFEAPNREWARVRIPFAAFRGKGVGIEDSLFDTTTLTRIGIVAIGREMKVQLAVSSLRFY